ncbi:hypothetical protein C8R43DRAFT_1050869 [Mycena crocata]|nr:hypothetical protein C8R43DRAFT_1050869 [Mycena crocata]
MTHVPQELIEAIIRQLDDTPSLKSCSLASYSFRDPSQRILHRSLRLEPWYSTGSEIYRAVNTHLTESPHLAEYITEFSVLLLQHIPVPDAQSLCQVLGVLKKVCRFTIGSTAAAPRWDDADLAPVFTGILHFIRRQDLTELHLLDLRSIPTAVLVELVCSAPIVSFYRVATAITKISRHLPSQPTLPTPRLEPVVIQY